MADMTDDILDGVNRKDMKAWEKLYAIYYAALCSYRPGCGAGRVGENMDFLAAVCYCPGIDCLPLPGSL